MRIREIITAWKRREEVSWLDVDRVIDKMHKLQEDNKKLRKQVEDYKGALILSAHKVNQACMVPCDTCDNCQKALDRYLIEELGYPEE